MFLSLCQRLREKWVGNIFKIISRVIEAKEMQFPVVCICMGSHLVTIYVLYVTVGDNTFY